MTREEVQTLRHGLYIIHWKSGGISLAAVGSKSNGDRWMACSNWTTTDENAPNSTKYEIWGSVKKVGLIAHSRY